MLSYTPVTDLVRHSDERFSMLQTIREYAGERLASLGEALELGLHERDQLVDGDGHGGVVAIDDVGGRVADQQRNGKPSAFDSIGDE